MAEIKTQAIITAFPTTVCAFSKPFEMHAESTIPEGMKASAKRSCIGSAPSASTEAEATTHTASVAIADSFLLLYAIRVRAHANSALAAAKVSI